MTTDVRYVHDLVDSDDSRADPPPATQNDELVALMPGRRYQRVQHTHVSGE